MLDPKGRPFYIKTCVLFFPLSINLIDHVTYFQEVSEDAYEKTFLKFLW